MSDRSPVRVQNSANAGLSVEENARLCLRDRNLDLTLLVGSGQKLPRVPVLTELLEGAARELMVVRVQGPLGNPRITAQPLRSVDAALKLLLTPREKPAARTPRAPNR